MRITQAYIHHLVMEELQLLNEVSLEKAKESLDSKKLLKAIRQYAINYAHSDPWEWKDVFQDEGSYVFGAKPTERALRPQALNNMVDTMHKSLKGWIWDMIPEDIETDRTRRDKSNQALALLWLLRLVRTDPGMMKKLVHDYAENDEETMENIEMYFNYKHLMEKPDLNSIKSTDELAQVVLNARDAIKDYQEKQSYANADEGTEVFRDDEDWMIAALHNKGAACELGKGTDWCTAAPGLDYFAEYYEEDDPLFYFQQKKYVQDDVDRPPTRMQFHYGSDQFMDEQDHPLPDHVVSRLHNMLMQTEAPEKYSILRKYDRKVKIAHKGTHPEVLDEFVGSPEMEYGDYMKLADHPNASEKTLRKLAGMDIHAKDYLNTLQGGPIDIGGVSLKAVLAKREVSPEFTQELWEKTWEDYQQILDRTDRQLRSSKYNEEDPDWYANVSARQFHRVKEFFMPVWKKIAWNPMVATSTLEKILEATDPSDYVKEMIKQKIIAREAGEEELDFHELRRRVVSSRSGESDEALSARRAAALRAFTSGEQIAESKVFSRWQKIIN